MSYQLAHINLAASLGPREDPRMAGFFENLEYINGVAEKAPGFIWRLEDEAGDATGIEAFPDPSILISLSIWDGLDSLREFVYKTVHVDFLRRRQQWFKRPTGPNLALWWVREGHRPTLAEARSKVALLSASGPTAESFTFGMPFPAPSAAP